LLKEELELRGAPVKVIVHDEVVEDEEPMVCRLTAGGRWIRTIGPRSPVSSVGAACRSCLRGSGAVQPCFIRASNHSVEPGWGTV